MQPKFCVSFCIETILMDNFGTWSTFRSASVGLIWTSPILATVVKEPSVMVIFLLLDKGYSF